MDVPAEFVKGFEQQLAGLSLVVSQGVTKLLLIFVLELETEFNPGF